MSAELRAWVAANPKAPAAWRALALRLADYHEAAELWAAVEPLGARPVHIMTLVRDALAHASDEMARAGVRDEAQALDRVARKVAELRDAIERSPLPADSATLGNITGRRVPAAQCVLFWRDIPDPSIDLPAYHLSIVGLLDAADRMLDEHRAGLAPRAVLRHRDRPAAAAFVRWADWLMGRAFGERPPGALAHLANAALDLADPLGPDDVRAILKDSPEAFTAPT